MKSDNDTGAREADAKEELELMQSIYDGLKEQSMPIQQRVLRWVLDRLELSGMMSPPSNGKRPFVGQLPAPRPIEERNSQSSGAYETFADLYNAAGPTTGGDMALVGGYWLQVCKGAEDFVAADVNKELKNAGAKVANITVAFNGLMDSTPRLALQIRKSGKTKQARKRYKLTQAGIKAAEDMIKADGGE